MDIVGCILHTLYRAVIFKVMEPGWEVTGGKVCQIIRYEIWNIYGIFLKRQ